MEQTRGGHVAGFLTCLTFKFNRGSGGAPQQDAPVEQQSVRRDEADGADNHLIYVMKQSRLS